jgi:aspartate/methionine/tyrosine aminotransferase
VTLDPESQVVATLGSKEGFANMAQAITAPGDVVLVPNPSYPIHAFGFLMAGGVIRSVPSAPTPDYFVALERAIIHSIPKPIAVVVLSVNPTAEVPRSTSTRISSPSRRSTRSSCSLISPTPKCISTTIRRPRCCRCRARWM